MAWSNFATVAGKIVRDLIRIFKPDAEEREAQEKMDAREEFVDFLEKDKPSSPGPSDSDAY